MSNYDYPGNPPAGYTADGATLAYELEGFTAAGVWGYFPADCPPAYDGEGYSPEGVYILDALPGDAVTAPGLTLAAAMGGCNA